MKDGALESSEEEESLGVEDGTNEEEVLADKDTVMVNDASLLVGGVMKEEDGLTVVVGVGLSISASALSWYTAVGVGVAVE